MDKKPSSQSLISDFMINKGKKENKFRNRITTFSGRIKRDVYPFLKWAGGKRQLIPEMKDFFPKRYSNYIEPFVGGGAVFFYLLPSTAILIDNNLELINCYRVIKKDLDKLIESLKEHKYEKEYYYKIRALDRIPEIYNKLSNIEKASRTIFLNKTGYNGLYRVNSKGQFNVPFGRHKNPKICDEENLIAVHEAIQNIEIIHGSFELCLDYANEGDFVYLDPPYYPLSDTALFTSYTKENFGEEAQIQLFEVFKQLDERGCKLVLNNSYCNFILDLYKDYKIVSIKAKRAINSVSSKRGFILEVLIMN